jgi:hypothetical protein
MQATQGPAMQSNTQQNLNNSIGGGQGPIQSLTATVADSHLRDTGINPQEDPRGYIDAISKRIDTLSKLAEDAAGSDPKKNRKANPKAAETYMQVVGVLKERLHAFQTQYAAQLNQEANQAAAMHQAAEQAASQPATQPAASQQAAPPRPVPNTSFLRGIQGNY